MGSAGHHHSHSRWGCWATHGSQGALGGAAGKPQGATPRSRGTACPWGWACVAGQGQKPGGTSGHILRQVLSRSREARREATSAGPDTFLCQSSLAALICRAQHGPTTVKLSLMLSLRGAQESHFKQPRSLGIWVSVSLAHPPPTHSGCTSPQK